MKKMKVMAMAAAVACIAGLSASAEVIFEDLFEYTVDNAMIAEGGWTAWSGTGGATVANKLFWGPGVDKNSNNAWLEYNYPTAIVAGKVVTAKANQSRPGNAGYGYTMSIILWDGADVESRVTVAGGVQEIAKGTALTPVSYRTTSADVGKFLIFKYAHTQNWSETLDVKLEMSDPSAPVWTVDPIQGAGAFATLPYTGTLAGQATDPNGDPITFKKESGPAWLTIAENGALSGTPATSDIGTSTFSVSATDVDGTTEAVLKIVVAAFNFDVANSKMISMNFVQNDPNQGFEGGQMIGPLASDSTYWNSSKNRTSGTKPTGSLVGMIDDRGTNTGATIAWASSGTWYTNYDKPNDQSKLGLGYLDDGAPGVSITISNIPYASYKVYGLIASDKGNGGTSFNARDFQVNGGVWAYGDTESSTTRSYGNVNANNTANGAFWTETVPNVSTGNYWTVTSSGTTLTVTGLPISGDDRGSLAGLIIEKLSAEPKAPVWKDSPITMAATAGRAISGTLAGRATDPNGDVITFSKSSGAAWLTVDANGTLSGTAGAAGTNTFTVVASDGALTASATLNIVVVASVPPVWTVDPMQGPTGVVGFGYGGTLAGKATDANGDPITYSVVSGPTWLSVAENGVMSGIPTASHIGLNTFTVKATDVDGSKTAVFTVNVIAAPKKVLVNNTTANGSFEEFIQPEVGKVLFVSNNVPSWKSWAAKDTADHDTGTEPPNPVPAGAPERVGVDGSRIAFLQPGSAIMNMVTNAPHTIKAGDTIVYSVWNTNPGRSSVTNSLIYDTGTVREEIPGTAIVVTKGTQGIGVLVVPEGAVYIGKTLGIGIQSGGSWPEIDQVYLGVTTSVVAVEDLAIAQPSADGSQMVLSWTGAPGLTYAVETNSNLMTGDWLPYVSGLTGNGPLSVTNPITVPVRTFYRVITN